MKLYDIKPYMDIEDASNIINSSIAQLYLDKYINRNDCLNLRIRLQYYLEEIRREIKKQDESKTLSKS
jgi:hypothetical protein